MSVSLKQEEYYIYLAQFSLQPYTLQVSVRNGIFYVLTIFYSIFSFR